MLFGVHAVWGGVAPPQAELGTAQTDYKQLVSGEGGVWLTALR